MTALVECVPNVSEGRDETVLAGLAETFTAYRDVHLLHRHSDTDHNRTVFTVVGEPQPLLDAVFELYERAVETIDLRLHRGVHPRLGAVDVCPFIPLTDHGSTMDDCRGLARRLGLAVSARFGLPVFLYRESATRDGRRALAAIRHGQFEQLDAKLSTPEWVPDFGPTERHPTAGVTIVGARPILVAFNVVLATGDVEIARAIAGELRESGGGLYGLRAMGVCLGSRGLVQVSMNVEDYRRTPLQEVVQLIDSGARARHRGA
ncbi:MAG: glutamate formimidoyltransferase [Acidobacteria bacterium]|nr:glutamate formimidoyltransferase [Acidobacteriota bacterium]